MMKIYEIRFKGLWMGGTSLILAHSQEEAVELLKKEIENDENLTEKLRKINESQFFIIHEIDKPKVFYYYNGDY